MANQKNRLGITGTVYYQRAGINPSSISLRGSLVVEGEEEPFIRTPPNGIGTYWKNLDTGWLGGNCSLIVLRNLSEEGGPSIEIGAINPHSNGLDNIWPTSLAVPPGLSAILYPTGPLVIRATRGKAQYGIYAVPR